MRRSLWWIVLSLAILLPTPGFAAESQCPLPVTECLLRFQRMRERPWLGVDVELDSVTQQRVIVTVAPEGPADKAGMRVGDILIGIEGQPPAQWFAGKAGWKDSEDLPVAVVRGGVTKPLTLKARGVPEDILTRAVGVHMLEGHLAYMHGAKQHEEHH